MRTSAVRPLLVLLGLSGALVAVAGHRAAAGNAPPAPRDAERSADRPSAGARDGRASFAVAYRGHVVPWRVFLLRATPGEEVGLEVRPPSEALGAPAGAADEVPAGTYRLRGSAGRTERTGPRSWRWRAPASPRLHRLVLTRRPDGAAAGAEGGAGRSDSIVLNAAVLAPRSRVEDGRIRGYRVGTYPDEAFRGLARYRPPEGYIRVPRRASRTRVSPHFRLGQFPAKRPRRWPRFVVLQERLLLKLELLVERAARRGVAEGAWTVMSGYRSPWYNRTIGQPRYSRHQYGDAADLFVDRNGDGRMDDLNGDGRVDILDADVLYDVVDRMDADPELRPLVGGLGKYRSTPSHGPFVHVDTRGYPARW